MPRILITGSRTWRRPRPVRDALAEVWDDGIHTLVSGACPYGADAIGEMFWRRWGGRIERHPVTPADRRAHGGRAFLLRDAAMVDAGADLCIAFINPCLIPTCERPRPHGSHGASFTADRAEKVGTPVLRFPCP